MNCKGKFHQALWTQVGGPWPSLNDFRFRISILGIQISNLQFKIFLSAVCLLVATDLASATDSGFVSGTQAYRAGDYAQAAKAFRESVKLQPAAGTLQNLANAEWQRGHTGPAILAWEQALWLDPFEQSAHDNLRFARKTAQIETQEVAWYEVVSSWLPVNWWAWIAGISFWLAIGMVTLPGIFRRPKAAWHQAVAALALMLFLLSVPAHVGVYTRSRLGFVLEKDTPLRLTPTQQAQAVTRLAAGEPARWQRSRGRYVLLRTNRTLGWVDRDQFGLISP